ncbi:MAG: hypothetical protein KDA25_11130 [Phycisphaerales bacterium]|nr:hypothetical protein [Phycisphaerales bacterium]
MSTIVASRQTLEVRTPRIHAGDWSSAWTLAVAEAEPVFVPVHGYTDDRGWSYMNLLNGVLAPEGQVNFSAQYPGVVKAWHRHRHQTDFWMCVTGNLKAGVYREDDGAAWCVVIGEKRPGVLVIPPTLWHGATPVGPTTAGLLYYVTRAYDARQPDEERRSWDGIEGFPWEARHG